MYVRQVSVFMENKVGKLGKITSVLRDENIDVRAFSIADTTEFGILRLIVREPERAAEVLRNAGMTAQINEIIVALLPDKIGAFDDVVRQLCEANINIKYLYSFIGEKEAVGRVAICADNMKKTLAVLQSSGCKISECADL